MDVLVIDGGSSSLKLAVLGEDGSRQSIGIERIGAPDGPPDMAAALAQGLERLELGAVGAVGHRVVHGCSATRWPR